VRQKNIASLVCVTLGHRTASSWSQVIQVETQETQSQSSAPLRIIPSGYIMANPSVVQSMSKYNVRPIQRETSSSASEHMYNTSPLQEGPPHVTTRVMSPNHVVAENIDFPTRVGATHDSGFMGIRMLCEPCGYSTVIPSMCTGCGDCGHDQCLHMHTFQDFRFCRDCIVEYRNEYARMSDGYQHQ